MVQPELHRPTTFDVTVRQASAVDAQAHIHALRQRTQGLALGDDPEIEAVEVTIHTIDMGQQRREPTEAGIDCFHLEAEARHRRLAVDHDLPGQRHLRHGRGQRRVQDAVLKLHA